MTIRNISIIIPAKNEAPNISIIVTELLRYYKKYILEIIIVDDCSTDNTKPILKKLQKIYPQLKPIYRSGISGVGLALCEGIRSVSKRAEYVLCMDCDFVINVPDIKYMILLLDKYDGVVGSRFIDPDSLKNYPLTKFIANRVYHFLAFIFLGIRNNDLTNNFKLYRRDLIATLLPMLSRNDFAINAELGFYAVMLGAKIGAVPVKWWERTPAMGFSKFKILKVGPSYAWVFLRILKMRLTQKNKKDTPTDRLESSTSPLPR